MSMLREWSSFADSNIILEYKENPNVLGAKDCYLRGIAIQADRRNLNERVYPLTEISEAVGNMALRLKKGESILCECDHPDSLTINLDRVAGMITEVWMEGANGMATIKLLPTIQGENIRRMLENGVKLGVSSRGSGDVDHRGYVSNFEIVTVDIVAQPSAPEAYPKAVFESLFKPTGLTVDAPKKITKTMISESLEDEIHSFFKDLKG